MKHLTKQEVLSIFELAVDINGIDNCNNKRPMIFVHYQPHTQNINVSVYSDGWNIENTNTANLYFSFNICDEDFDKTEYERCKNYLNMLKNKIELEQKMRDIEKLRYLN